MALTTFTNGTVANADEVNANFTFVNSRIKQIYTGSDIDRTTTGESFHELTAVASSQANYVEVSMTGLSHVLMGDTGAITGSVELKAQIKETGGAYGDIIPYSTMVYASSKYSGVKNGATLLLLHTLTAGQKSNGYQIKIFCQIVKWADITTASFTNSQVIVRETD